MHSEGSDHDVDGPDFALPFSFASCSLMSYNYFRN